MHNIKNKKAKFNAKNDFVFIFHSESNLLVFLVFVVLNEYFYYFNNYCYNFFLKKKGFIGRNFLS
jgi:hypothetical protein